MIAPPVSTYDRHALSLYADLLLGTVPGVPHDAEDREGQAETIVARRFDGVAASRARRLI